MSIKKILVDLSHMTVSGAFGFALAKGGDAWFHGGAILILALFLVHHYYNVAPLVRKEHSREISKMLSDHDD